MTQQPAPSPVPGEVIETSKSKVFGFLVLGVLSLLFGVFLIWAFATDQVLDRGKNEMKVSWWGLGIGILAVLGGLLFVLAQALMLVSRPRLIIAADRFQVADRSGVGLEIPYANIASVLYVPDKKFVAVHLRNRRDPRNLHRRRRPRLQPEAGRVRLHHHRRIRNVLARHRRQDSE